MEKCSKLFPVFHPLSRLVYVRDVMMEENALELEFKFYIQQVNVCGFISVLVDMGIWNSLLKELIVCK